MLLSSVFPLLALFSVTPIQARSAPTTDDYPPDHSVKLYYWPLSKPSPSPLAQIRYSTVAQVSIVDKYSPPSPKSFSADEDVIRIGLYDPATKAWSGVVTSTSSFKDGYQGAVILHLDNKGEVWHVDYRAFPRGKEADGKKAEQLEVKTVSPTPGPQPHLNVPVVLDPEGKLPDETVEKPLWQRQVHPQTDSRGWLTVFSNAGIGGCF
ncbi:MAG: hypothetical protein M1812_002580 [Candelaria pacifica]|nr:MAG: hypothetical protein M1812_002580 [Candelaria pacifica]